MEDNKKEKSSPIATITIVAVIIALMVIIVFGLSKLDIDHAYAEITTNSGKAELLASYNGLFNFGSKSAVKNRYLLELESDDVVAIRFSCRTCGYEEYVEFSPPYSHIFACDCTGKKNASCEYLAITCTLPGATTPVVIPEEE